MRQLAKIIVSALLALAVAASSQAQDHTDQAKMAEMLKMTQPGERHKHLESLVGRLRTVTTLQDKDHYTVEWFPTGADGKEPKTVTMVHTRKGAGSPGDADTRTTFFENLRKMCGQRFAGETQFPPDPNHPLAGKKLVLSFDSCTKSEIRIPFHVGEDKSRTWILTLSEKGLLFKHDHRHPDGTPDKITMYGGWAASNGTSHRQSFPADPDTAKLIPEATTNVWTLEILPEKQQLIYYLERNSQPRYRAVFNLKPLSE